MSIIERGLLDGVIFAGSDGWEPHIFRHGPRKGQAVERKRRVSGNGYHYREPAPVPAPSPVSDATRMLQDRDFNLADPVSRGILHDALIDEDRGDEAAMLAGHLGDTLIYHRGRLRDPHTLSCEDLQSAIDQEANRSGSWASIFISQVDTSRGVPAGTVDVLLQKKGFESRDYADSYAAATVIGFMRANRNRDLLFSEIRPALDAYAMDQVLGSEIGLWDRRGIGSFSPSLAFAHAWLSSEVGKPFPTASEATAAYMVRRVPVWSHAEFGYYYTREDRRPNQHARTMRGSGRFMLFLHMDDLRRDIRERSMGGEFS